MEHPQELFIALPLILNSPSNISYNLLIARHKYWKKVELACYQKSVNKILFFDQIFRAHSLKNMFTFLKKIKQARCEIKKLPIQPQDVLISFSHGNYIENVITSVFNKNRQIYICRDFISSLLQKSVNEILFSGKYQLGKSDLLHYLILEPLAGLKKRTLNYWEKNDMSFHAITYSRKLNRIYDEVFLLESLFKDNLVADEIYFPYALFLKDQSLGRADAKKKVVFFLSGPIRSEGFYENTTKILQNICHNFGKAYELVIRLHPDFPNEYQEVDCAGWAINTESGSGEQYLINHAAEIEYAISNISTVLIFSLNMGINSYSYHRCFNYTEIHKTMRDKIYEFAPEKFYMNSLEQLPIAYQHASDMIVKAQWSIERIFQSI